MKITVRQAEITEIDKLMAWRMEVLQEVFPASGNDDIQSLYSANRGYYLKSIPSGSHIAVFADIGKTTVGCGGMCLYSEMPSPDNSSGKCAYLMNIYTKKKYRGESVGKAVVRYLVGKAQTQGISKLYLETSDCGRKLYECLGFQDMTDYMKFTENCHE